MSPKFVHTNACALTAVRAPRIRGSEVSFLALGDVPTHETVWARSARGEEHIAQSLAKYLNEVDRRSAGRRRSRFARWSGRRRAEPDALAGDQLAGIGVGVELLDRGHAESRRRRDHAERLAGVDDPERRKCSRARARRREVRPDGAARHEPDRDGDDQ